MRIGDLDLSVEHAEAALEALDYLLTCGPKDLAVGLCSNLDTLLHGDDIAFDLVETLAEGWPHHSGDRYYPVRHPDMPCIAAYDNTPNLWVGEYGDNRLSLTRWVRDRLAELIEKETA